MKIGIRITPAYAGNTTLVLHKRALQEDHPRLRGEYFESLEKCLNAVGSPPPTRGILKFNAPLLFCTGITPAYAGNTYHNVHQYGRSRDHPRLRGEYNSYVFVVTQPPGSPPPTRGIPHLQTCEFQPYRITPAYAGNTVLISAFFSSSWDHPRLRGEYLSR